MHWMRVFVDEVQRLAGAPSTNEATYYPSIRTLLSQAVQGLLNDFGKALGITFKGADGEEFFRSSLIQTAFYGLFPGRALWWHEERKEPGLA